MDLSRSTRPTGGSAGHASKAACGDDDCNDLMVLVDHTAALCRHL
jgi:hypothetical protein